MKLFGLNITRAAKSDSSRRGSPAPAETYQLMPKLSLLQIRSLVSCWAQGDLGSAYDLMSVMIDTWPVLAKNQHEVRDAVRMTKFVARPFAPEGEEPTKSALQKASFVNACLKSFSPVPGTDERGWIDTLYQAANGINMPTVLEVLWERSAGDWHPRATAWVAPRQTGFDRAGRLGFTADRPPIAGPIGVVPPKDSDAFLVFLYDTRSGPATMTGLLRPLTWWWGGMMYGRDWLMRYAEMFGLPFRKAIVDPSLPATELAKIDAMLAALGSAGYVRVPPGSELEFVEAKGVSTDNPQRFMLEHGDRYCNLLYLGQTLTSTTPEAGGGTRAQGEVHAGIRRERIDGLCAWIAENLTLQLVRAIIKRNWGTVDECPILVPDYSESIAPKEQAEIIEIYDRAGWELDEQSIAEISSLPLKKKAAAAEFPPLGLARGKQALVRATGLASLAAALRADQEPLRRRLEKALAQAHPDDARQELRELLADLPQLIRRANADPDTAREIEHALIEAIKP